MRFLSVFLVLLCSNAHAEKLIFSNNNEQVDITGDVVIDNQSGNITVTTEGGDYVIVGDDQPIILGFYPNDYEITANQDITVNWAVVNADNCTATTSAGSSSWSGSKNASDGNNEQTNVSINQLPSTLRLVCSNDADSVTKSFQIKAQPAGGGGNPVIDSFTVNSQSNFVTVSSASPTAQFDWTTTNVSSCTASANPALPGWSGSKGVSGSEDYTITRDTTVSLSCDNAPVKTVNIDFTEPGNPNCSSLVYPPLAAIKVEKSYTAANGAPFGTEVGNNIKEIFGTNRFLALSGFSTNQINFDRTIATYPSATDTPAWYGHTWSVSECPGDFTSSATCTGVIFPYDGINITTNQNNVDDEYCVIQPGVNYYLNLVHDIEPYDQTPGRCHNPTQNSCSTFLGEI